MKKSYQKGIPMNTENGGGKKSREKNCRGSIHEVKFLTNRSFKNKEQKNYRKKIIKEIITFKNSPELS